MKCKLAFLLGVALSQCFVWGENKLEPLRRVYACWGGSFKIYDIAYKKTYVFVEQTLKADKWIPGNNDLIAIYGLLKNRQNLEGFLDSLVFKESREAYNSWLKNLFHLAYETSVNIDERTGKNDKYLDLLLSSNSIGDLLNQKLFKEHNDTMATILDEKIDWNE